jgi:hypothetical protein
MLRHGEIIFLLGAGASFDAGIPISSTMISKVEELIKGNRDWNKYKNLYYFLKSAIQYGIGITGESQEININIEMLVNTMDELTQRFEHPLYPFVGSWIPRLSELAGEEFSNVRELHDLIITELATRWMGIEHKESAAYYKKLSDFQVELKYVLPVFSLNYDKCIEEQCAASGINRGFENHEWTYKKLEYDTTTDLGIYLYKLHGSIDWSIKDGIVKEKDNNIPGNELAIIFGTSYKLQYLDPFLYLVYEFRRQTLDGSTKIINCIGYSFNDEHINGILGQALKHDKEKRIVAVFPFSNGNEFAERNKIMKKLKLDSVDNIYIENKKAKEFFENDLSVAYFDKFLGNEDVPY